MAISKSVILHRPHLKAKSVSDPLDFPGLKLPFALSTSELPEMLLQVGDGNESNDPFSQFMFEIGEADINSWGVVVNSFEELESGTVSSFESFYESGAKAWCLGPLNFYDKVEGSVINSRISKIPINQQKNQALVLQQWLNEQVTLGCMIYVSFGTQADLSEAQLDEVVFGLEEAGIPFVLVVRSTTWSPPNGLEDRLNGKLKFVFVWTQTLMYMFIMLTSIFKTLKVRA